MVSVTAVEEKAGEAAWVDGGRAGVCLKTKCADMGSSACDEICRDGGYRGGICLPPAKYCCCVN